jgi:acyl dehydratase
MNTNPIHFDAEYASRTEFKKPLVNSCFTLALVTGQSVTDLTMNGVANLGWDNVKLPHPLFEGDTVYSKSEVLATRESRSRPKVGIVTVKTTGMNQHGVPVIEFTRTFMVWKRTKNVRR